MDEDMILEITENEDGNAILKERDYNKVLEIEFETKEQLDEFVEFINSDKYRTALDEFRMDR